jgi:hypothetical protein
MLSIVTITLDKVSKRECPHQNAGVTCYEYERCGRDAEKVTYEGIGV